MRRRTSSRSPRLDVPTPSTAHEATQAPKGTTVTREASVPPGTEAVVETSKGSFTIRLLPEIAPRHAALFVKTAKAGGYDGTTFHRVIAGGIIQGGDPLTKDPAKSALYGTGGLGLLKAEISERRFVRGAVGAARRPSSIDSGGGQFFVCLIDQPVLDGKYTLFGEVVSGLDVLDLLGATPVEGDRPTKRLVIKSVTIRESGPAEGARNKE